MTEFNRDVLHNYNDAIKREWLITNSLGGYASSSIICANSRRYHGLLVAAPQLNAKKFVIFSQCQEEFMVGSRRYELSTIQLTDVIHPEGYHHLESFHVDPFPRFVYRVNDAVLEKKIFFIHDQHTVVVMYTLLESPQGQTCCLNVRPFLPFRDIHTTEYENAKYQKFHTVEEGCVTCKPYDFLPPVYLLHNADEFSSAGDWLRNVKYLLDKNLDLETHEDMYTPGKFVYLLRQGESCYLSCSLSEKKIEQIQEVIAAEENRVNVLLDAIPIENEVVKKIACRIEDFNIYSEEKVNFVVSGYHWLTMSTREVLIGFPGLFLINKNFEAAKDVLKLLAKFCDRGFIPSSFPDESSKIEYNSIDTSLWFFYAIGKYLEYTQDYEFIKESLLSTLLNILDYYVKGTRYGVGMDQDGLIISYERAIPLTWIDQYVKPEGYCRWGKLVEVNALWYNALKVMEHLIGHFDDQLEIDYKTLANEVNDNFNRLFWNAHDDCLYDEIHHDRKQKGFFVNQVFALSLSYPVINKRYVSKILLAIENNLYTPYGLKPFPESKISFPWLLGHFYNAYMKCNKQNDLAESYLYKQHYEAMLAHLNEAGIDTISECFKDTTDCFEPKGCIAYMLSNAEFVRVWTEYIKK